MSTKLIAALILLLIAFGGYRLYVYYQKVERERWLEEKQTSSGPLDPTRLDGMARGLEEPLKRAEAQGAEALGDWLEAYGTQIRDPRKAWIQLDYCTLLARDDPRKARDIYHEVRERVDEDSPVYERVMQMHRTFE
jgi:hypothetical protein